MIYDCIFTVLLNFTPNRFCFIWEPHELVWGIVWFNQHSFFGSIFYIFFKKSNFWNLVSRFSRFQTQENRFFGLGTFLHVFFVQKNIDLFTALQILYKFWKMFHKSVSYEPSRQYGTSPFSKTIIKEIEIFVNGGIGKLRIF